MKRITLRNMSLVVLALTLTVMSCQKSEKPPTEAQDSEEAQTPVIDEENTEAAQEAAVAAAAKVASPVPGYKVTYPYGIRNPRYAAGYHTGDDYAAPTGKKVVAVLDGTIVWSNNNGGAYGRWIGLRANGRDYIYCHLSVRSVSTGTKVKAGDKIGEVGATGNVTGPHLHFEDRPAGGGYGNDRKPKW
jgi:murein DD-endopeptidase MepM/ murein hydrolase activator NlpD